MTNRAGRPLSLVGSNPQEATVTLRWKRGATSTHQMRPNQVLGLA